MALTFNDLDYVAINEVGGELAAARNLLNKSSSDFVLDLRTTRHHVNAIEAGDLRIFYGAPFYIDLLRRYAKALNFSDIKILEFEKRVLGFTEDKSENISTGNDKDSFQTFSSLNQNSLGKSREKVFTNVKILRKKLKIDPTESKILKEKIDRLLLFLLVLIVLVSGFVFILPINQTTTNAKINFVDQVKNESYETRNKLISTNSSEKNKINRNTSLDAENKEKFEPTNLSNYDQVNNLKIDKNKITADDFDDTSEQIQYIADSTEEIKPDKESSQIKVPRVSLYASEKTWYWIRYYDDSVNEFMVDADSTTNILNFPIYLVIGKPEVVEMTINGSIVYIERNDPDRNLARYTRTELRAMSE